MDFFAHSFNCLIKLIKYCHTIISCITGLDIENVDDTTNLGK